MSTLALLLWGLSVPTAAARWQVSEEQVGAWLNRDEIAPRQVWESLAVLYAKMVDVADDKVKWANERDTDLLNILSVGDEPNLHTDLHNKQADRMAMAVLTMLNEKDR